MRRTNTVPLKPLVRNPSPERHLKSLPLNCDRLGVVMRNEAKLFLLMHLLQRIHRRHDGNGGICAYLLIRTVVRPRKMPGDVNKVEDLAILTYSAAPSAGERRLRAKNVL